MSMSWGEILDLYVKGAGGGEYAIQEQYIHASEAHRRVIWLLDLPESHITDEEIQTVKDQDWVNIDPDVAGGLDDPRFAAIDWVQDQTSGTKLRPEPGGMRGRVRYYEAGQKRPPLTVQSNFYVRKGSRLYLRDTPDAVRTLVIGYMFNPLNITKDDVASRPITPDQYDFQIAQWAIGNYFKIHPPQGPEGVLLFSQGQQMIDNAKTTILGETTQAKDLESLDTQHYLKLQGYEFGLMGR